MDNPKSKLQELVSKHNGTLPTYSFKMLPTPEPLFRSEVTFVYDDEIRKFESLIDSSSKKKAECSAAEQALAFLEANRQEEFRISKPINKRISIFIDYENYNDDDKIDRFKEANPLISVAKVTSKYHVRSKDADMVVDSRMPDAADVFITCQVAEMNTLPGERTMFIVTNDHFATCIADIYDNCHHMPDIQSCFDFITSMT